MTTKQRVGELSGVYQELLELARARPDVTELAEARDLAWDQLREAWSVYVGIAPAGARAA